jgi:hypothetical protein
LVFGLREEDPTLGVRRIAARVTTRTGVSVSRETVRKLLREAERAAVQNHSAASAGEQPVPGVMGQPGGLGSEDRPEPAVSAVRPMTEADHAAMDREPGARVWVFR